MMACTAILSFDQFRDSQQRAQLRQQLHDRLDQRRDRLEAGVKAPKPPLEDMT
jgi:hypothetical protein